MSYIFNEWWERNSDEIFRAARHEDDEQTLHAWMLRCWELATDLAWINAAKTAPKDIVRYAELSQSSEEAKRYSEIP